MSALQLEEIRIVDPNQIISYPDPKILSQIDIVRSPFSNLNERETRMALNQYSSATTPFDQRVGLYAAALGNLDLRSINALKSGGSIRFDQLSDSQLTRLGNWICAEWAFNHAKEVSAAWVEGPARPLAGVFLSQSDGSLVAFACSAAIALLPNATMVSLTGTTLNPKGVNSVKNHLANFGIHGIVVQENGYGCWGWAANARLRALTFPSGDLDTEGEMEFIVAGVSTLSVSPKISYSPVDVTNTGVETRSQKLNRKR